ncbi:sterol desaturase family protein [Crocinitomicaceae bacterium]|nr:sterol desaturase family protein [Crocinitomicaceae bacterium]
MALGIITIFLTFIGMEGVAWLAHKYIMHGIGWFLHKDHHVPHNNKTEKNDFFFLIFAIPSWLCIMLGMIYQNDISVFIGYGIIAYGICYIIVHEIFIHQRLKLLRNTNKPYFKAIRYAHKIHHKHLGKEHGECFGMLFVPFKYYKKAIQEKNLKK